MAERSAADRESVGSNPTSGSHSANPGYAAGQLAKALATAEHHEDPATRARARKKAEKWSAVFEQILDGSLHVGSRTPVSNTPAWATLEVVTGGFATGALLAGGPLLDHERNLAASKNLKTDDDDRLSLNRYFLTDDGLRELSAWLADATYEIDVPEEAALLVVAWLANNGHTESARDLLDEIGPFLSRLRFYPQFVEHPRKFGSRVFIQDVKDTIASLQAIQPNAAICTQQEAIEVWTPLYDDIVALFLETVEGPAPDLVRDDSGKALPRDNGRFPIEGGWPCKVFPEGWKKRANTLLHRFDRLARMHKLSTRATHRKSSLAQLMPLLRTCASDSSSLSGRDVGRIRLILARYVAKRGVPGSPTQTEVRSRQAAQAATVQFHKVANAVTPRLQSYPANQGIEDLGPVLVAITEDESEVCGAPAGQELPAPIHRRIERCLFETTDELVDRGLIPSGDELAKVLPQITSGLRAAGITDPSLRELYAATYRAFRRRRSLLLLDLQSQVRIEELPWVAAIEMMRSDDVSTRDLARQTLEEVVSLSTISFPQAILPNKLLQEIRALADGAGLDIPIVDELASDIFMGEFSSKFLRAAKLAGELMANTLYARYYNVDYEAVQRLEIPKTPRRRVWSRRPKLDDFASLCCSRAGVQYSGWDPATNGMIIEQQQILTTQNLAPILARLNLVDQLRPHFPQMARSCFAWICRRQQVNERQWHARLITIKNTAYAWRQMVLYLSFIDQNELAAFVSWADEQLASEDPDFQRRFAPALAGLREVVAGGSIDDSPHARRFLGWKKGRHWLLSPDAEK